VVFRVAHVIASIVPANCDESSEIVLLNVAKFAALWSTQRMAKKSSSNGSEGGRSSPKRAIEHERARAISFERPASAPIEIPMNMVSDDALEGLIESFILREGTDYGVNEVALTTKKRQVREQIEIDDVKIIFDPDSESVTLLTDSEWAKLSKQYTM